MVRTPGRFRFAGGPVADFVGSQTCAFGTRATWTTKTARPIGTAYANTSRRWSIRHDVDIKGITPHDSYAHALVEMRCAREVICNAVRAEREGYDAFVIGHFQDAGLYEAARPSAFRWWCSGKHRCCTAASSANAAALSR